MSDGKERTSAWVNDTGDDSFEADVIERSGELPVVVDFWAQWCAPCRTLGPILESLAEEFGGKFLLVKADTDACQNAAARFGVSGIPAVFGVVDGEVVDGFQGALPEPEVRKWLSNLLGKGQIQQARELKDSAPEEAEGLLRDIIKADPNDSQALILLAEILLTGDGEQEGMSILSALEARGYLEPEAQALKSKMELKKRASLDLDSLQAAAASAPDDLQAKFALAEGLVGNGDYEQAFQLCLQLVEQDRKGLGEDARALMVEVFRALPADSELTREYRKKLSLALY